MDRRYSISDASRQIEVENHVLRYWEEELGLAIERNNKGHRFYKESDIHTLKIIKDLKEQGFQLKAIKLLMPDLERVRSMGPQEIYQLREELNQQVMNEEEPASSSENISSMQVVSNNTSVQGKRTSEEKFRQFEKMLRQMITSIVNENEKVSEERICKEVSTRLMKEMDYIVREREEIQEKQTALLKQILEEVKSSTAANNTISVATLPAPTPKKFRSVNGGKTSRRDRKTKKGKLFAKTV